MIFEHNHLLQYAIKLQAIIIMSTAVNPINIYTNKWNLEQEVKQHLNGDDGSFYTCNLSDVIKKYNMWLEKLPRVKPHYAVSNQL